MALTRLKALHTEWPTLITLASCYAIWALFLAAFPFFGWTCLVPVVLAVVLHSSLQHEALHGHPTRAAFVNEMLVLPALGLWFPYRRYRRLHLKHHIDVRLTDPFDDPESWYLAEDDWLQRSAFVQLLLRLNSSLLGRITLGPALAWFVLWRAEFRLLRAGHRDVQTAWALHVLGVALVMLYLNICGIDWWIYTLAVAYPALSILLIRSFIEHRAAPTVSERTAVIEAGRLMSLLFLNNNLHAVHHLDPAVSWYRLPERWQQQKESLLQANGKYHFPGGYWQVAKNWLVKGREPIVHPYWHRVNQHPSKHR